MQSQHCRRNRVTFSLLGVVVTLALAGGECRAGMVFSANAIEFQALTTDMIAASVGDAFGTDPASVVTYNGSFDQAGWNGTFGGVYQGNPVGGTMSASVFGDPNYQVTGGITMTPSTGQPYDTSIQMTLEDQGNGQYALKNAQIGTTEPWKWTGTVTDTVSGMDHTLKGTLQLSRPLQFRSTWDVDITIKGTGNQQSISSTFKNKKNPDESYSDKGKVQFTQMVGANFNGFMNEQVAPVPEPASLTLFGIGAAVLGGYGWRRRRRIARNANELSESP